MAKNHEKYSSPVRPEEIKPFTVQEHHPQPKSFRKGLKQHFQDYCSTTSIHGFGYFGENRTYIEYIFWAVVFTLSICGSIYMIYEIYIKWYYSPVLVSFATRNTPIYDVPFPAVTICPKTVFDRSAFNKEEYMKKLNAGELVTEEEKFISDYLDRTCDTNKTEFPGVLRSEIVEDSFSENFYKYFMNNSAKRTYMLMYRNNELLFEEAFKPTVTQEGLCYTFNRLRLDEIFRNTVVIDNEGDDFPQSDWDQELGYSDASGMEAYPRRALLSGMKNALQVIIVEDKKNVAAFCRAILQGYQISLHLPSRIPRTSEEFFFLPLNDAVLSPVTASIVLTSDRVRNYAPSKRDCYFPSERNLRYFAMYTQKNCEMECLTNITLKHCNCVEFYMPRENGTNLCGNSDEECAEKWQEYSQIGRLKRKIDKDFNSEEDCDCLPMCTDINYNSNVAPLSIDKDDLLASLEEYSKDFRSIFSEDADLTISALIMYFKDDSLTTTERNELYGPSDFLSNFGGLLGLFTGFSILSCMEILYFCTLRIFGNIKLFGYWAGPPNLDN